MKTCQFCGQTCEDSQKFCNNCGAPFQDAPVYGQPQGAMTAPPEQWISTPRVATKKEFLALPENKKVRSELTGAGVICYVCAAITAIAGLALLNNPYVLLDAVIVAGLGLGIHLAQSRACAVILCVYAAINLIFSVVTTGAPGGYLVVIAGVFAVIYTFKAEKLWQQYQQGR